MHEAVLAYRNADGGFGHAMEPDVRVSTSQPIFVHFALSSLHLAGIRIGGELQSTCEWLGSIATSDGAVPYLLPDAFEHARADHWNGDWCSKPSLIATTAVAGGMHAQGVEHEWLDRATAWCLNEIRQNPPLTPHTAHNILDFLTFLPKPDADLWNTTTSRLLAEDLVLLDAPVEGYGITPIQYAPAPDSKLRALFDDDVINAHLDDLAAKQMEDGGWPISWNPPKGIAADEWRGRWTLVAYDTLKAYGRAPA